MAAATRDPFTSLSITPQYYRGFAPLTYLVGIAVRVAHLVDARAGERAATEVLSQTRTPRPREAAVLTLIRRLLAAAPADLKGRKGRRIEFHVVRLVLARRRPILSSSSPNSMQS